MNNLKIIRIKNKESFTDTCEKVGTEMRKKKIKLQQTQNLWESKSNFISNSNKYEWNNILK